jgi:hypothetical protein
MAYKDPEQQKEAQRQSYLRNKEKIKARCLANAEAIRRYKKKYRLEHKEHLNDWNREYRRTHPEVRAKQNAYDSKWRREKKNLKDAYRKTHPEYDQKWNELRRARRAQAKLNSSNQS